MLSSAQLSFFDTFGFLDLPGLLADRAQEIVAEFERMWAAFRGHNSREHDGRQRSCSAQFVDQSAVLSTLLDDPRIEGIASSILGDDFNYGGSDGNLYIGDTGWHSDGWYADHKHIKIAFYLDAVTRNTGCLRVIPGSHKINNCYARSLQQMLSDPEKHLGVEPQDVPSVALEINPGDILVFNHNLKHAAFGGNARRRMFTMNCSERYPEERLDELRNLLAGGARFWVERAYGDAMMDTANNRRMRHLEQFMANDGHLAELSRKARETMSEPARGRFFSLKLQPINPAAQKVEYEDRCESQSA